jgi:Mn-dependent DtxR family transcriptional regulator
MEKSNSSEDYMKSILILEKRNTLVRSIDIAEEMGVTKPSVCNAMKKLREKKMIYFDDDGHIFFTKEGRALAEKVYSKHSLLAKWLMSVGVSKDTADREACMMEHAISDETYECLGEYINAHSAKAP